MASCCVGCARLTISAYERLGVTKFNSQRLARSWYVGFPSNEHLSLGCMMRFPKTEPLPTLLFA